MASTGSLEGARGANGARDAEMGGGALDATARGKGARPGGLEGMTGSGGGAGTARSPLIGTGVGGATDRRAADGSGGGTECDGRVAAIAGGTVLGDGGFGAAGGRGATVLTAPVFGRGTEDAVARGDAAGALGGLGACEGTDPDSLALGGAGLSSEAPAGPERDVDIVTPCQF